LSWIVFVLNFVLGEGGKRGQDTWVLLYTAAGCLASELTKHKHWGIEDIRPVARCTQNDGCGKLTLEGFGLNSSAVSTDPTKEASSNEDLSWRRPEEAPMQHTTKALNRLHHLKQELDSLYYTAEYDRLRTVIDGIRVELEKRRSRR